MHGTIGTTSLDNSQEFNPVAARVAELWDGCRIKALYAGIVEAQLRHLKPDRYRNWRSKPTTYAEMAAEFGCKVRTIRTALKVARATFPWFNWRQIEHGVVFVMQLDGTMIGNRVTADDAKASFSKESTKQESASKGTSPSTDSVVVITEEGGPAHDGIWWRANVTPGGKGGDRKSKNHGRKTVTVIPVAEATKLTKQQVLDRLSTWRATLAPSVILFGIELGLTEREVWATAERFVRWYTAHPDRCPRDLTAAFTGFVWLQRDAARKAAATHNQRAGRDPADRRTRTGADPSSRAACRRRRYRPGRCRWGRGYRGRGT
jgi:hypothetical protein